MALRSLLYRIRGHLLQKRVIWLGRRMNTADYCAGLEAYIGAELLPRLQQTTAHVLPMGDGISPIVRRIICGSGSAAKSWLIRCFPWPPGRKGNPRLEHATVAALLREHGIAVPQLCSHDSGSRMLGEYGFEVTVEKWVEGRAPRPADFAERTSLGVRPLAEMLARLHGVTSPQPGRPWSQDGDGGELSEETLWAREEKALERIRSCSFLKAGEDLEAIRRRLAKTRPGLESTGPFSLVHGDLEPSSFVLTAEAGVVFIEFSSAHFGFWPEDFVRFHETLAEGDAERTCELLEEYRRLRPNLDVAYFHRAWAYLHLWHHVERAAEMVDRHGFFSGRFRDEAAREYYSRQAHGELARVREILLSPGPMGK